MADAALNTVLRHLRRVGTTRPADELSDRQLLDDFLRERDEVAFAALLRRHGPMVLGVCRRVLRHPQDADDAFQASFLVLLRHAASIRRHDSLASWLYGVALRTALRSKLDAGRRRRREERAAARPLREPGDEPDWRDLRAVLDEEIARLPEKYRGPLVLCHLEGCTNVEAARRLRLPSGSLSKRLARARGLLRSRLMGRGVALSAGALLTVLAGQAAAVPPLLAQTTTGTALLLLAGSATVPASIAALADGVTRSLWVGQLKGWLLSVLVLTLLIGGGVFVAHRLTPASAPEGTSSRPVSAMPREKELGEPEVEPEPEPKADPAPPPRAELEPEAIKQRLLFHNGGDAKSEAAVAAGLLWLAKQQAKDGHWAIEATGGQKNDIAGTAFGLLPLLGAGHTHKGAKSPFAKNVQRGLDFLLQHQKNGDFGAGMYAQALASSAVFQAYALTGDPKLAAPAKAALAYLLQAQHEGGGWRYTPRTPGDLSVSVWVVTALHDARAAGLEVPHKTLTSAAKFVASCAGNGGGYIYVPGSGRSTPTMTAAALLARGYLFQDTAEESFRAAVPALVEAEVGDYRSAMHSHWVAETLRSHGGTGWAKWNAMMRPVLVERQEMDGGWTLKGDLYGQAGGRLMVTSLTLLTLEVYYRGDLVSAAAPRELTAPELKRVWPELMANDPVKARRSLWALVGSAKQSLPLLEEALTPRPTAAADEKEIKRLIKELDDDSFDVREKATTALAKLGGAAEAALRKAAEQPNSAESGRRLKALVAELDRDHALDRRRSMRALEVVEYLDAPEARQLLKRLAKEARDPELAKAAKAALERVSESRDKP